MKEHKGLNSNVDFYSASVYYMMGFPIDLDTPVFACSRISGWTAHVLEQYSNNRLIRPRAEYVGPKVTEYVPIDQVVAACKVYASLIIDLCGPSSAGHSD